MYKRIDKRTGRVEKHEVTMFHPQQVLEEWNDGWVFLSVSVQQGRKEQIKNQLIKKAHINGWRQHLGEIIVVGQGLLMNINLTIQTWNEIHSIHGAGKMLAEGGKIRKFTDEEVQKWEKREYADFWEWLDREELRSKNPKDILRYDLRRFKEGETRKDEERSKYELLKGAMDAYQDIAGISCDIKGLSILDLISREADKIE